MCPTWALVLLAATLAAPAVQAAGKASPAVSSRLQYQRDTAACRTPPNRPDRDDCLSEASTAFASREPVSVDADPGRYLRNALKRCEPLTEPDRSDCVARIQGQGTTSGSVAGGGIYRELVTREVGTPASAPEAK